MKYDKYTIQIKADDSDEVAFVRMNDQLVIKIGREFGDGLIPLVHNAVQGILSDLLTMNPEE